MGVRGGNSIRVIRGDSSSNSPISMQPENSASPLGALADIGEKFNPEEPGYTIPGETRRVPGFAEIPPEDTRNNKRLSKFLMGPMEKLIRETLRQVPDRGDLRFKLGLSLIHI